MTVVAVWAPLADRVRVRVGAGEPGGATRDEALTDAGGGWWRGPDLAPGTDYAFVLGHAGDTDDRGDALPDPASRWQPAGIHGPSRIYDQDAYSWTDQDWSGREFPHAVIYELHIGTFTPGATFDSAIDRLAYLVDLGITHVEVLPVNAVSGVWNWGYDGVGWYAVHEPYGGPDGLKRFVDACHRHGLAVLLDVVYNHLGPSGNYLPEFGPYFTRGQNTWGDLINLGDPDVREFVIANALMWLRDYHLDGLRLDAVHALHDPSPVHVLTELSTRVELLQGEVGRQLTLIAESDLNDPVMVEPRASGGHGLDAQWNDDVHHALHATLTGERQGYYCDFGPLNVLAKTFTSAFLHDGTFSTFRGRPHGRPIDRRQVAGWRFVVCLQNHDQVGNRAGGERLTELTSSGLLRAGAVLLLTGPFTPMIWMGEEWAAGTRWPFFTSHPEPELAARTGPGRIEEFEGHGWDASRMVDPQDPSAYHGAVLDWVEPERQPHAAVLALYRDLIALRAAEPQLRDGDLSAIQFDFDDDARWLVMHRGSLRVILNLAGSARRVPVAALDVVLATGRAEIGDGTVELEGESAAIVRVRAG